MRPNREWLAAARALARRAIRRMPIGVRRLAPNWAKRLLRPLFANRNVDPYSTYLFPDVAAEVDRALNAQTAWLRPFFASVGLQGETATIFLAMQAAGYPVYSRRVDAERMARTVRTSGYFDASHYAAQAGDLAALDPALHYVVIGERMGFAPSQRFDPAYYFARYAEARHSFRALLVQHVKTGIRDGRRGTSIGSELAIDRRGIDPARATVLVIAHEASRTGAPILAYNIVKRLRAKYNVVTLLLSGGDIAAAFAEASSVIIGPFDRKDWHPAEAERLVGRLLDTFRISFAIANSIDSRVMMKPLALAFVPVVALVHEFASYLTPKGEMGRELGWATQTVFSAGRVLNSAREEYPNIDNYRIHVAPQGPVELPPAQARQRADAHAVLRAAMRPPGAENAFVVLGCGTIYPRKGVDLFVSCAAAVAARNPERPVRFVWIGERLPPDFDKGYFSKLLKQIKRAKVADKVALVEQVAELEPAYALADAFFLSSRLDPLPNVTIDSALRALPIVCFDGCSGIADILVADDVAQQGVVPHLDVAGAADLICALAADETRRRALGQAAQRIARDNFDMERYIARLDAIGRESMDVIRQRQEDFATICASDMFDTVGFLGPYSDDATREGAIRLFLAKAAMMGTGRHPSTNFYYRRPAPGFHPQIYAHENRARYDTHLINPLAHFIRSGQPKGPWTHEVIMPVVGRTMTATPDLKAALHVHFHYPELCAEFLAMLSLNRARCDLFLTTNGERKAQALRAATAAYDRGEVAIIMVPNRGRDIGAFLSGLDRAVVDRYDVIGHLHSKRSLFIADRHVGERWRGFIWRNLVGRQHPMMDVILGRMADDTGLGLVFPDDPHLSDWDHNLDIAGRLARRIGMAGPLSPFFNFPIGTMFWARSAAVAPLFGLGLTWDDYPQEPAPIDGTVLHALERLLPFVAEHAGYRYATTHVPGVTW